MSDVSHLPDFGLECLIACLELDFVKTADHWYLDESRRIRAVLAARHD